MQTQELLRPEPEAPTPSAPLAVSRSHSPLGQITVSLSVLATGVLAMVDLSGVSVRGSAYFAIPLAVVGFGLLLGAWYGRARWLAIIGLVLSGLLAITAAAEAVGPVRGTNATWRPSSLAQIDNTYKVDLGNATLDLTAVDFAGQDKAIDVKVGAGNLTIILPSKVDAKVEASVDVGNANVFGTRWGGVGQSSRTVSDNGADGPGGGQVVIRASVDVGNMEVRR